MPNLIVICGPHAVGKMTVAEALRDKIKYNLMINHDSIEVSDRIFGFATPAQKEFNNIFREKAFEIAVKHNVDLIFTCVCGFDMPEEKAGLISLAEQFQRSGGSFYFVELFADLETRLARNETPHRMEKKPSKKEVERSHRDMISSGERHRLNSLDGEIWFENHLKIDNTSLDPNTVADIIIKHFNITPNERDEREYRYGV